MNPSETLALAYNLACTILARQVGANPEDVKRLYLTMASNGVKKI